MQENERSYQSNERSQPSAKDLPDLFDLLNERHPRIALEAEELKALIHLSIDGGRLIRRFYSLAVYATLQNKGPIPVANLIAMGVGVFESPRAFITTLKLLACAGLIEKVDDAKQEVTFSLSEAMKLQEGRVVVEVANEHPELSAEYIAAQHKTLSETEADIIHECVTPVLRACACAPIP